jgi:hypothetical protein
MPISPKRCLPPACHQPLYCHRQQGDKAQPMGVAEYKLLESLPAELQTSLPSIEQIENELGGLDE